jgi:hypothetical protein
VGKLLDVFSQVTYKGEKVNLDYGTVSLKDLLPSKSFLEYFLIILKSNFVFRRSTKLLYI